MCSGLGSFSFLCYKARICLLGSGRQRSRCPIYCQVRVGNALLLRLPGGWEMCLVANHSRLLRTLKDCGLL